MSAQNINENDAQSKMSPAEFSGFIVSLAHTTLMYLGELDDPSTGEKLRNIEQARYNIDIIDMLITKTKGNLTAEEDHLIQSVSRDLKMKYVRLRQSSQV
jgi:hypothetical protein